MTTFEMCLLSFISCTPSTLATTVAAGYVSCNRSSTEFALTFFCFVLFGTCLLRLEL